MSRIGKKPISIPQGVTVTPQGSIAVVKGPKGQLEVPLLAKITIKTEGEELVVERANNEAQTKANHGLIRSLLQNAVIGVTEGYKKTLKLVGTGYRVQAKGAGVSMTVGYSHPVEYAAPQGVSLKVEGNDTIHIEGIDKQAVGQVAAEVRMIKPPEAYKGKGIRYEDEIVRTKPGKTAVG